MYTSTIPSTGETCVSPGANVGVSVGVGVSVFVGVSVGVGDAVGVFVSVGVRVDSGKVLVALGKGVWVALGATEVQEMRMNASRHEIKTVLFG